MGVIEITTENKKLTIVLSDKSKLLDEHGQLMIELIEEALGNVDFLEVNEFNGNMHHGGLWVNGLDKSCFIFRNQDIISLKESGKAEFDLDTDLTDYVDTDSADHMKSLMWYYNTEDIQDAVQQMYDDCGWVVTDIDNFQAYKELEKDELYKFRQNESKDLDECTDEELGDEKMVETTLRYSVIPKNELVKSCKEFGYDIKEICGWMGDGEDRNIPLVLECYFEMN